LAAAAAANAAVDVSCNRWYCRIATRL
jgi:hypothetical protein